MELIDKSALVAELKKRFDYRVNGLKAIDNDTFWDEDQSEDEFNAVLTRCAYNAAKNEVFELMCFLDTLEVKECEIKSGIIQKDLQIILDDGTYIDLDPSMQLKPSFSVKEGERVKVVIIKLGIAVSNKAQKGEKV